MASEGDSLGWRPGGHVAGYRLVSVLGAGAMGRVFSATHLETGAERAIKIFTVQAHETARERFLREGQAQALADHHPNVLRVHTSGVAHGVDYLVMDLASGGDLFQRLRTGPLEPLAGARLVLAIARGLAHVHAAGVLHRDLKPANIVFDERDVPKIADFGLARLADAGEGLTQTGELLGTPHYMPPEQARRTNAHVDERSDVYGLGAILYEALTAQPPFLGESQEQVLAKVLTALPEPPSRLAPGVPPAIEDVCLLALAKSPADRYASADEFADALQDAIAESAGEGGAVSRRRPRQLLAAGAVAVSIALLANALVYSSRESDREGGAPAIAAPPLEPVAVATPATPELALDELWAWRAGQQLRSRYVRATRFLLHGSNGEVTEQWRDRSDAVLAIEVEHVGSERVEARVEIEALSLELEGWGQSIAYSSAGSAANSPLNVAVGGRFRWFFDPGTGESERAPGVEILQRDVLASCSDPRTRGFYRIALLSERDLCYGLNRLLHVRGTRREGALEGWTSREADPASVRSTLVLLDSTMGGYVRKGLDGEPGMQRIVRVDSLGSTGVELSWHGEGPFRSTVGRVRLEDGRVTSASARETLTSAYGGRMGDMKIVGTTTFTYEELSAP